VKIPFKGTFMLSGCLACMLSCSNSNPAKPVDTVNSMWYKVVSPQAIPDTLYYGQSLTFQVAIGDSDGDKPSAAVSGLPPAAYNITSSGDTAFVTLNLAADSLRWDSLYTVSIGATGVAAADSLVLPYSFRVIDSARLGGLRKLVVGTWWAVDENDSLVYVKDTAGIELTIKKNDHHHKMSRVTYAGVVAGNLYYGIETADTVLSDSSQPTKTGLVLRHTASQVDYTVPPKMFVVNEDSVDVTVLALPFSEGKSWQTFAVSGDTGVRIYVGTFPFIIGVNLTLNLSMGGTAQVSSASPVLFGGMPRSCWEVVTQNTMKADYLSDTTIVFLGNTILSVNDTVMTSDSSCTVHSFFNDDLSTALWSYSLGTKRDSNYVDRVVVHSTVRTASYITSYYDARTGKTYAGLSRPVNY
jgi:hypothetical protein